MKRITSSDLRLAARSFGRHRLFSAVAVLSLALAIALNTTMYSVIDAMVSPNSDVHDADRVFGLRIWGDAARRVDDETRASLLREAGALFDETSFGLSWSAFGLAVEYGRQFRQTSGSIVAPNYFHLLGIQPMLGRSFVDDDVLAPARPVLISSRLMDVLFKDGESPLSKVVHIDGEPHPVVGVIKTTSPNTPVDIWVVPPPSQRVSATPPNVVRLKAGVTPQVADRQLHVLSARFAALAGQTPKDTWFQLVPMNAGQFHLQNFHYALIAAVVAVLLIACSNLANLQLARGIARARELAVRAALGATRRDLIAQLVLESALLSVVGLLAGLLLTFWGVHILASRIPPSVGEYVLHPQTSWRVLVFAVVACTVCVMLVGLLPAIRVSRVDPSELIKSGAGTGAFKKSRRQYGVMVAIQVALSLALLSGAGVVVQSALYVNRVKADYDLTPLSEASIFFTSDKPPKITADFATDLLAHVRSQPDVVSASVHWYMRPENDTVAVYEGGGQLRQFSTLLWSYTVVSPEHLRTLGITTGKGRDFGSGFPERPEIIIDQQTARTLWPGLDPIGREIKLGNAKSDAPWLTVVGVTRSASDERQRYTQTLIPSRMGFKLGTVLYLPGARDSIRPNHGMWGTTLVVRSAKDHERMPITLRRALHDFPNARFVIAQRMEEAMGIRGQRQSHDFVAATFVTFAALAVALAALGIYGIVAHSVAERRRELGVRIALGASNKNILNVVLRDGNVMLLAGVATGLLCTRSTVDWLAAFSYEDAKYDALLFAAMAALLFAVAIAAAFVPALRATRIDPVESLRSE